jgi:hypothetical protein
MKKLAFTGISGSGKDYLVDYLVKEHGYHRVSFSDQLKKLAKIIYPWMEKDYPPLEKEQKLNITTRTGEVITKTPREIWLELNSLRTVENQIFIRMLEEHLEMLNVPKIIISDIRPENEWLWAKKNGFTTIYIEPMKKIYEPNDFDKQVLSYKDQADYIFENNFDGLDSFKKFISDIDLQ